MDQLLELSYQIAQALLIPVLATIYLSFIYGLLEIGRLFALGWLRMKSRVSYLRFLTGYDQESLAGYPITTHYTQNPGISLNEVEIYALRRMETVRIITRISPMLGLIATLIPMGPALMALAENNVFAMSEHLRTAFTAVILGLSAASLTFWSASVKKRWYAEEISAIEKRMENP